MANWIQRFLTAIATHKADASAHHVKTNDVGVEATVAMFQATPATGTFAVAPDEINNNVFPDAGPGPTATAIGQYAAIDFGKVVCIRRWRHFGDSDQIGDGAWSIQYYDLAAHAWTDWVTGITNRTLESWSGYSTETEVLTDKVRLIVTTLDSGGNQRINELEVIY